MDKSRADSKVVIVPCSGIGKTYGAVSRETVFEMARGARVRLGADIGMAVSGIAGPGGGMPGKPVGLTWKRYQASLVLNRILTTSLGLSLGVMGTKGVISFVGIMPVKADLIIKGSPAMIL